MGGGWVVAIGSPMVLFRGVRGSRRGVGWRSGVWVVPSFGVGLYPVVVHPSAPGVPVPGVPPSVAVARTGLVPVRVFLRRWGPHPVAPPILLPSLRRLRLLQLAWPSLFLCTPHASLEEASR